MVKIVKFGIILTTIQFMEIPVLFAKIAGLLKNYQNLQYDAYRQTKGDTVLSLQYRYDTLVAAARKELPDLYSDLPVLSAPKAYGQTKDGAPVFLRENIEPTVQVLEYILEVRAQARIAERQQLHPGGNSIFITHGRSSEWRNLQSFVEKTLGHSTIELAQQPNLGRTILQKLDQESDHCRVAIIVMTGDDETNSGEIRSRENVLHEIGFFQGKLGFGNIILLHEEGVNIPSNIHGLVYVPFPKGSIETTFGAVVGELNVLMNS